MGDYQNKVFRSHPFKGFSVAELQRISSYTHSWQSMLVHLINSLCIHMDPFQPRHVNIALVKAEKFPIINLISDSQPDCCPPQKGIILTTQQDSHNFPLMAHL